MLSHPPYAFMSIRRLSHYQIIGKTGIRSGASFLVLSHYLRWQRQPIFITYLINNSSIIAIIMIHILKSITQCKTKYRYLQMTRDSVQSNHIRKIVH